MFIHFRKIYKSCFFYFFMKRKLVKQGAATMMISLPSKWVKANKLDKGDEVDLIEKDNELVIGTKLKERKDILIEISDENKRDIANLLTHAYRKGFDKIILKGKYKEALREIKTVVNDLLLGFELTEMKADSLIIENISEPTSQKYDIILKKVFQIIEDTGEIVVNDFENGKFKSMQDIEDLRKQHDRFVLFCRRLLIKENIRNAVAEWELLTFLMHIEHSYYYLYKFASESKIVKSNEIVKLLKELKDYFELYGKAYWNNDINAVHKINSLKKEYQFGRCLTALEKSKGKETVILAYIKELFRLIQIGTSPILIKIFDKNPEA